MIERVAIMGAGIAGTWLAARLKQRDVEVRLFDKPGMKLGCACAWGTETRQFRRFMHEIDIEPRPLIMRHLHSIRFQDTLSIPTDNFCTINRPKMITTILNKHELKVEPCERAKFTEYDRIIDCTGHARAYLPPPQEELFIECRQKIVRSDRYDPTEVQIVFGNVGYGWIFPLGHGSFHIGCGELGDATFLKRWMKRAVGLDPVVCDCDKFFKKPERVRLSPASVSLPFRKKLIGREITGCGENIVGTSPVAGEGIIPALRCAELLIENWYDFPAYRDAVLREFAWMDREYRVIKNFMAGRRWRGTLGFLRCFANGKRFGIKTRLRDLPGIMKVIGQWGRRK